MEALAARLGEEAPPEPCLCSRAPWLRQAPLLMCTSIQRPTAEAHLPDVEVDLVD
jgi:hypothetical protein